MGREGEGGGGGSRENTRTEAGDVTSESKRAKGGRKREQDCLRTHYLPSTHSLG